MVDAIVTWFDLHLDEETSFSTSPAADTSWEQAVFPLSSSSSLTVAEGDRLIVQAGCTDTQLEMELIDVKRKGTADVCATTSGSCYASTGTRLCSEEVIHYVAREDLRRVNDEVYMVTYHKAIKQVIQDCLDTETSSCDESNDIEDNKPPGLLANGMDQGTSTNGSLCKDEEDTSDEDAFADCIVLDVTSGFSLFGLVAASEGASFVQVGGAHSIYGDLLRLIAQRNSLDQKVSVRQLDWSNPVSLDWDMVVCDVVSPQGTLQSETLLTLQALW